MTVTDLRFIVDVEKRIGSEFWTNVYQVVEDSLSQANTLGLSIAAAEAAFHHTAVLFTRIRVRTWDPEDEAYVITTVNSPGGRGGDSGLLPLFNTLRVDFPAAIGRPSRKYYRGVLQESDISGEAVTTDFSGLLSGINALLASVAGATGIVDPQLQLLSDGVPHPFVQMRQLRRSRRRRQNGAGIFQ